MTFFLPLSSGGNHPLKDTVRLLPLPPFLLPLSHPFRADAFSYEIMCQGKEKLQYYINDYNRRSATLGKKEQDTMKDMHIVQEMYARGYEFLPIDIYKIPLRAITRHRISGGEPHVGCGSKSGIRQRSLRIRLIWILWHRQLTAIYRGLIRSFTACSTPFFTSFQ